MVGLAGSFSSLLNRIMKIFEDRADAGSYLADRLKRYDSNSETIVLGHPRGGIVAAFEVSQRLQLPLDVFVELLDQANLSRHQSGTAHE